MSPTHVRRNYMHARTALRITVCHHANAPPSLWSMGMKQIRQKSQESRQRLYQSCRTINAWPLWFTVRLINTGTSTQVLDPTFSVDESLIADWTQMLPNNFVSRELRSRWNWLFLWGEHSSLFERDDDKLQHRSMKGFAGSSAKKASACR